MRKRYNFCIKVETINRMCAAIEYGDRSRFVEVAISKELDRLERKGKKK